eukprot:1158686-Pelagomonas_calceolata.AAC.2
MHKGDGAQGLAAHSVCVGLAAHSIHVNTALVLAEKQDVNGVQARSEKQRQTPLPACRSSYALCSANLDV